ncbi:signal transduction histidine kinase [Aequitasia blattaphilus]|uniref:Histidine kinase domain-containing protein n=1 Tax=Aequitasia blattaphilus TaxID=2949332 RepID=A0ABT1EC89_9FIRM|nr:hypothetical protein [Aequitasia blattaphilus]MCP1103456.1 hypothetical protein [Aequitasia blattaphilus]MCR8616096.1 hypothetical protein [Aequitasia blattaphilus]
MSSKRYSRQLLVISIICYALIVWLIISSVVNFREKYRGEERSYISNLQENILECVYSDDMAKELDQLVAQYAIEVMIYDENDNKIYGTLDLEAGTKLHGIVNDNAKVLEKSEKVEINGKQCRLWYVIYQIPFVKIMEGFLFEINVVVVVVYLIFLVLIIWFEFRLLIPLQRIAKSIEKAENNEIDDGHSENHSDVLNARLTNFFLKQRKTLSAVRTKNTVLEMDLALEREHLENTIQLSRALVHDLKSPIYNVKTDNEIQLETEQDKHKRAMLKRNIDISVEILTEINGILKVLREDVYSLDKTVEKIDGVKVVYATQKHHVAEMRRKKMSFFFEGAEEEWFSQNKVGVQLLFHNIFSNMVLYSLEESSIEVTMERRGNQIVILSYNNTDEKNIQRIQIGMKYDMVSEAYVSDSGNVHSSGNGLYLIRQLAKYLGGECSYRFDDHTVITELILPDKGC